MSQFSLFMILPALTAWLSFTAGFKLTPTINRRNDVYQSLQAQPKYFKWKTLGSFHRCTSCRASPRSDRDYAQQDLFNQTKRTLAASLALFSRSLVPGISAASGAALMKPGAAEAAPAVGYKAAESAFAPGKRLYAIPLLPQSALLNSLPLQNELIAELQAYLESFVQLINPSPAQDVQIKSNTSVLWTNLRINAQRAAGMFLYNKEGLLPDINDASLDDADLEVQQQRLALSEEYISQLQVDVLRLVNASRKSSVSESLRYMRRSLNDLGRVADMLVPLNITGATRAMSSSRPSVISDDDDEEEDDDEDDSEGGSGKRRSKTRSSSRKEQGGTLLSRPLSAENQDYSNIPRLLGRATVVLAFTRPGQGTIYPSSSQVQPRPPPQNPNAGGKSGSASARYGVYGGSTEKIRQDRFAKRGGAKSYREKDVAWKGAEWDENDLAYVTIVVDGINHPLTGGSFIDQCLRGYYDSLPVLYEPFEYDGDIVYRTVFGFNRAEDPFVDPLTERPRRVPLEILRDDRAVYAPPRGATAAGVVSAGNDTAITASSTTTSSSSNSNTGSVSGKKESESPTGFPGGLFGGDKTADKAKTSPPAVPSPRYTATGLAQNSVVFTRSQPVLSFATYGAIGLMQSVDDGRGAKADSPSSSFFWVRPDRSQARSMSVGERHASPAINRLNNRFSLFAHVVEGNDVLELLRPGDVLLSAEVQEDESAGVWKLIRPSDTDAFSGFGLNVLGPEDVEDD